MLCLMQLQVKQKISFILIKMMMKMTHLIGAVCASMNLNLDEKSYSLKERSVLLGSATQIKYFDF